MISVASYSNPITYSKRAFFDVLEHVALEIFSWGKPQDPNLSYAIFHTLKTPILSTLFRFCVMQWWACVPAFSEELLAEKISGKASMLPVAPYLSPFFITRVTCLDIQMSLTRYLGVTILLRHQTVPCVDNISARHCRSVFSK